MNHHVMRQEENRLRRSWMIRAEDAISIDHIDHLYTHEGHCSHLRGSTVRYRIGRIQLLVNVNYVWLSLDAISGAAKAIMPVDATRGALCSMFV